MVPAHREGAMPYLTVTHRGSHRFEVNVEGHRLLVDEGVAAGGRDSGPTPTELLAASLASCAAAYAESYLTSHGHSTSGLLVAGHQKPAGRMAVAGQVALGVGRRARGEARRHGDRSDRA